MCHTPSSVSFSHIKVSFYSFYIVLKAHFKYFYCSLSSFSLSLFHRQRRQPEIAKNWENWECWQVFAQGIVDHLHHHHYCCSCYSLSLTRGFFNHFHFKKYYKWVRRGLFVLFLNFRPNLSSHHHVVFVGRFSFNFSELFCSLSKH